MSLRPSEPEHAMAPTPNVPLFKGTHKAGENPQQWLQTFDSQTYLAKFDEAAKVEFFGMLMAIGETAGDWWEEMQEKEEEEVKTMAGIRRLFERKWPRVKKTGQERKLKQWQLKQMRLREEEIGTWVEYRGREIPAHHAFAARVLEMAMDVGDESGLLIDDVRENLPESISDLTIKDEYNTWQEFYDGLVNLRPAAIDKIREKATRNQSATPWAPTYYGRGAPTSPAPRLQHAMPATPATPHMQASRPPATPSTVHSNFSTPRGPPASPTTPVTARQHQNAAGRPIQTPGNPFYQPQTPGTPTPSYGHHRAYDILRPFPTSPQGWAAYEKAVTEWRQRYASSRATFANPFPLRPGGAMLDRRECFQCGKEGHISISCTEQEANKPPIEERNWRADASAIRIAERAANRDAQQIASLEEVAEQGNEEEPSQ
ncbi:hypothetical protein M422DRAFT_54106 [Sphaerobolus stellatus SS14]|uniref:CCHC-type domain-containing protein n=1 Tax=Sphaerobolus stellatus (strain SS14) TaxID=990650 RepID=A0A0C9UWR7_SPHS4|nr:hypothetical protein M422DRAFT_54106 [Sphaerobolus stellatus SS14]